MTDAFKEFDKYVEDNNIQPDEIGAAFAAFLNKVSGWDGDFEQVEDDPS